MKLWLKLVMVAAAAAVLWNGLAFVKPMVAQTQAPALTPGTKAGEYFKNVTTSTLKELSVDDFLSSMGVISGALGFDCSKENRAPNDRNGGHYQSHELCGSSARDVLHMPSRARDTNHHDRAG